MKKTRGTRENDAANHIVLINNSIYFPLQTLNNRMTGVPKDEPNFANVYFPVHCRFQPGNNTLPVDTTIMVSTKRLIIGEQVVVVFVNL